MNPFFSLLLSVSCSMTPVFFQSKNTQKHGSHTRNKHSVPFSSAFVVSHAGVVLLLLVVVLSCSRPRANDTCM